MVQQENMIEKFQMFFYQAILLKTMGIFYTKQLERFHDKYSSKQINISTCRPLMIQIQYQMRIWCRLTPCAPQASSF